MRICSFGLLFVAGATMYLQDTRRADASGAIAPVSTSSRTSAITRSAAVAINGLKFCDVPL